MCVNMFVIACTFHLLREYVCCVYMHAIVHTLLFEERVYLYTTRYLFWLQDNLSIFSFYHAVSGDWTQVIDRLGSKYVYPLRYFPAPSHMI